MAEPAPGRLYDGADLQAAYESGHAQMYDHDSFVFLDRLDAIVESLYDQELDREEAELRAAALEGAADALRALAAGMWEAAPFNRRLSEGGL
jgi:hypothetical protein